MKDCIVLDNNIYCFQKHLSNGILVPKFVDEGHDNVLELLSDYLVSRFAEPTQEDVRKIISEDFAIEKILDMSRVA